MCRILIQLSWRTLRFQLDSGLVCWFKKSYRALPKVTQADDCGVRTQIDHRARCVTHEATALLDQAIQLDPKNASTYTNHAITYRHKNDLDHAIADYDQAIELDPKNAIAYHGCCWTRMKVSQQIQQALSECNESLRIRPDNSYALNSRGFVYLKPQRLDDAIVDFNAGFAIDPKSAYSLYGRGLAKLKKGDRAGGDADVAAAKTIQAEKLAADDIK